MGPQLTEVVVRVDVIEGEDEIHKSLPTAQANLPQRDRQFSDLFITSFDFSWSKGMWLRVTGVSVAMVHFILKQRVCLYEIHTILKPFNIKAEDLCSITTR